MTSQPNHPAEAGDTTAELTFDQARARATAAMSSYRPVLEPLVAAFHARGHRLFLVGGSVRDVVLGVMGSDLDFTTDARPETIADILDDYADVVWDTGIEFGTVSAEKDNQQLEITTFRADVYDGESRNPSVTFGDSLEGDVYRRDFTVNALALELLPGGEYELRDEVGGLRDLAAGVLDTPAPPEESFNDDPLRMLRAARFVSQLGFQLAPRVEHAMRAMAGEIDRITAERIQAELNKLLLGGDPAAGIDVLVRTGIADVVLPEITALQLTQDEHRQHKDVYAHSLQVLRQAIDLEDPDAGPDLVLRWAALTHDIGKPDTRSFDESGRVSFHHHEVVGAKMIRKRLRALKYSKSLVQDISQLVYLHMRFHGFSEGLWSDSAVRRYVTDAGHLLPQLHNLVRADMTTRNKRKAARLRAAYASLMQRIDDLAAKEDLARVRPDLDGNAIMELLGLAPGPEVGKAWAFLKEVRLEHGPLPREEAERLLLDWWNAQKEGQQ